VIARVVVAIDSAEDLPLVDAGCRLADEHHAVLEIVGGIAKASPTVALVVCPRALNHELELYSRSLLADAVSRVPGHIPLVWRHVHGCARRRLLRDAGDDRRVVLVGRLPWWARGALRRRLRCPVLSPAGGAAGADAAERGLAARPRAGTVA
jgi:hypothetical protein